MPNAPRTKTRNIRVHDVVWEAARERAEAEGTNVSAEVVRFLERYSKTKTPDEPRAPWGSRKQQS